jgi:hypothetical protein
MERGSRDYFGRNQMTDGLWGARLRRGSCKRDLDFVKLT